MKRSHDYKQHLRLIVTALAAGAFAYGYWLTNFVLNIDGEVPDNFFQTIALGRWFHAALRRVVLPEPFLPYFTNIAALVFLSVAALFSGLALSLRGSRAVFFVTLFITFPNLAYQLEFLNQADTFALGYALAAASAYVFVCSIDPLYRTRRVHLMLLASVLLALALGIYQTLALVPVLLLMGRFLLQTDQSSVKHADVRIVALFCAYILVGTAAYVTGVILSQELADVGGHTYVSGYVEEKTFIQYLSDVGSALWSSVIGQSAFGFDTYILASASAIFLLVNKQKRRARQHIVTVCLVVAVLLSPFAFMLLSGTRLPPRIYVAANLSFAILLTASATMLLRDKALFVLATGLCVVHFSAITSLFVSDKRVRDADIQMARQVNTVIRQKFPSIDLSETPVYFHGHYRALEAAKLPASDIFGSSFFAWDNGNDVRIKNFARYYGIADYKPVAPEHIQSVASFIPSVPTWPDTGSVTLINGVVVVKLSTSYGWLPFPIE